MAYSTLPAHTLATRLNGIPVYVTPVGPGQQTDATYVEATGQRMVLVPVDTYPRYVHSDVVSRAEAVLTGVEVAA